MHVTTRLTAWAHRRPPSKLVERQLDCPANSMPFIRETARVQVQHDKSASHGVPTVMYPGVIDKL
jgi:hypothetical protein